MVTSAGSTICGIRSRPVLFGGKDFVETTIATGVSPRLIYLWNSTRGKVGLKGTLRSPAGGKRIAIADHNWGIVSGTELFPFGQKRTTDASVGVSIRGFGTIVRQMGIEKPEFISASFSRDDSKSAENEIKIAQKLMR